MNRSTVSSICGRLFSFKSLNLKYLAILLLAMVCLPFLAYGQTATIVGTITDPSGAVVPNVTITITQAETGRVITSASNDAGQFVVPDIPIGHYNVKASATGFKVAERTGIVLNVDARERVDFQLTLGTTAQSVSVEANAVAVQTDTGEVSSLVSGSQITELSTNGRSIYTYVALTTGAASLMPDFQAPTPVGANSSISFNGTRPGHNLYLLDGGENSDRGGAGSSSVMPSMDAIAETQTLSSNYSADYGLSSGGTITSVVKSGSKTLHASAWEFFRNDWLDAANPFQHTIPFLRYNVYGFNAGGPVTFGHIYNPNKTKTFFFYNMEWRKMIQGSTLNILEPPTAFYTGNLSTISDLAALPKSTFPAEVMVPTAAQVSPTFLFRNCPGGIAPVEGGVTVTQGSPFPGNIIPSCMIDPNATALLKAGGKYGGIFPAPNGTSSGYPAFLGGNNVPTDLREEIVRIDHNFSDKFTIYGHYVAEQVAQNYGQTLWAGNSNTSPAVGTAFGNPSYAAVIHTAYTISPSLVNETSFNYNGNRIHIIPSASSLVSAPSDFTFNRFFTGTNVQNRIPNIFLSDQTNSNYQVAWQPWNNLADDFQVRDDVSWTKGRHQLRMGGSWALYKKTQDWFKSTQGGYTFNGSFTGYDFSDYLLGLTQDYAEDGYKGTGQWNNVSYAAYIQDNYRVNNRLTLNLGLRWDGIPHTYEASKNMANFYPNLYSSSAAPLFADANDNTICLGANNPVGSGCTAASPGLGPSPNPIFQGQSFYTNGMAICGNGVPRGCVNDSWLNIQPRIGFAYDLFGNGKTVIRGGYGVMNERIQGNDVYNNSGAPPLSASIDFKNVSLSNPKASVASGTALLPSIPVNGLTGLDEANYKAPRSTQFSLGVQQAFGKSVFSVAYVGTQNRHQNFYQQIALVPYADLPALQNGTSATPYNGLVNYPGYHSINVSRNEANGDYNGLQMSLRGSFLSNDLTYQLGYTYSHTNDPSNSGDLNSISNSYAGWKYDMGPSQYDQRQVFFANFVYDIPLMKHSDNHLMKSLVGGWEISGIIGANDGVPINLSLGGTNVCSQVPNCSNRPNITGTPHDPHTVGEWFDTSVYTAPAAGTWGNAPRYGIRGPGRDNWNMSLFKNFTFSESRGSYLQLRGEFFNVWNHTQLDPTQVSTSTTAGNFGAITGSHDPRAIQLALKLYF